MRGFAGRGFRCSSFRGSGLQVLGLGYEVVRLLFQGFWVFAFGVFEVLGFRGSGFNGTGFWRFGVSGSQFWRFRVSRFGESDFEFRCRGSGFQISVQGFLLGVQCFGGSEFMVQGYAVR